jgi:hypothetical protein
MAWGELGDLKSACEGCCPVGFHSFDDHSTIAVAFLHYQSKLISREAIWEWIQGLIKVELKAGTYDMQCGILIVAGFVSFILKTCEHICDI